MVGVERRVTTQPADENTLTYSREEKKPARQSPSGRRAETYRMYMMTPSDHMSHDLSYFSGPSTSGAEEGSNEMRLGKARKRSASFWS